MEGSRYTVTLEEFRLFHSIDRALFIVLVRDLGRLPTDCIYIMGLWIWLERAGFSNFISSILHLPPFLISELADEAMACLGVLHSDFLTPPKDFEIPLTHNLGQKDISLQFFRENCLTAFHEILTVVRGVCLPTMSDILQNGPPGFPTQVQTQACPVHVNQAWTPPMQRMIPTPTPTPAPAPAPTPTHNRYPPRKMTKEEEDRNARTMFVTFSKGYPVSEAEVRRFFVRIFGNCIESFHMQDVRGYEQALYARLVFHRAYFIGEILRGVRTAKFSINGKHVWMRKFVPKPRYHVLA